MAKILLGITALLLVGSAVLGFLNKSKLDEKTATLESTKGQLVASQAAKTEAEAAQKAAEESFAAEVIKREEADKKAQANKKAADAANEKVASLESDLADVKEKLAIASSSEDAPTGDGVDTEKMAELEAEKVELETALAAAEKEMNLLAGKFETEQSAAQALRDAEVARKSGIVAKQLEGRVLAYNPAWNFVVINLGDRQGMVSNAQMVVMRGSNMVGKIRVSSVEPSSSIADVIPSSMSGGLQIQPGDKVVHPGS